MQLVAQGKIDLDAEVRQYLPDFAPQNPYGTPITVRNLMTHQSGLVREPPVGHYFDDTGPTQAETVASLNKTKLIHKPGTITKYSNAALAVVGQIVERAGGQPFDRYMQETILEPLAMDHSAFRPNETTDKHLAHGFMWCEHLEPFAAPTFVLGTLSAGNLYSSVNDLSHFLIMLFNHGQYAGRQVVPAAMIDKMLQATPSTGGDPNTYGIGFRLGNIDGHRTFNHNGAVYGYATEVTGLPDDRLGVATVAVLDGSNGFVSRLTNYALRLMIAQREGKPLPDSGSTRPLPAGLADKLKGAYTAGGQTVELREFQDRLFLLRNYMLGEVRATKDGLVVNDVTGYGPKFKFAADGSLQLDGKTWQRQPDRCPSPCPEKWKGLLGEYGWDHDVLYIHEDHGQLWALIEWFYHYPLTEVSDNVFAFPNAGLYPGEQIVFKRDANGKATVAVAAGISFQRRDLGDSDSGVFRIHPTLPIEKLRKQALAAKPPQDAGQFRTPDLVELNKLDPTIKYDLHYATDRNFMGGPFYTSAHAFMQRPAAEALVRANHELNSQGYGLLIYDAYRPWYVTKMFWDGTPADLRDFVANPEKGSRHNRGCAVDLALYDLKTGEPIEMVGLVDEMSPRSSPCYPGGTARQRWRRDLLRNAMEQQGFSVYDNEWWHFDYKDWRQYPILNIRFEDLPSGSNQDAAPGR